MSTSKKDKAYTPFVYFVTNEELIKDARCDGTDLDAPEVWAKFLHLLKLEGLLKMTENPADVKNPNAVQHCIPDPKDSSGFYGLLFLILDNN